MGGGAYRTMDSVLVLHPGDPGSMLGAPKIYRALCSQWTGASDQNNLEQSRGLQVQLGHTPS